MAQGLQSAEVNGRRRFAAFISYAHADAAIASKLQSRLERYRLPKHLAQLHSGGQASLGQIFRDREDLAAAPSLSDAIRNALSQAEALVVICSPEAAASRWVGEEITLFRSLHPDRPVLAAVVRGSPEQAFPAALTNGGNEPLAADLRKEADGQSVGFLKIVAGIAGVPLDALIQRDAQRRIRRVMWITGAAFAAMVIMGVMTAFALQARNEAARQRASAEGLVEYMLTDLRTKLRGVGRPEVMNAVNTRAMEYYQNQGTLSALSPDSLERRSRVLHAMGEDDDLLNRPQFALAKFREAHRTTEALLNQQPLNPERIFAHAQSEYWVGQAAWRKRDRTTTTRHWLGYVTQARQLLQVDKNKARANLEMGYALGNLCDLYLSDNFNLDKAVENCRSAVAYEKKALAIEPGNMEITIALANRFGWLADALLARDEFPEARKAREAEQRLVDALLAKEPSNFELRFRQLWPEFGLILIAIEEGPTPPSADRLNRIVKKFERLSQEAPDNFEVKRALARALYMRAKTFSASNLPATRRALQEARTVVEDIAKTLSQRETMAGYLAGIEMLELKLSKGGIG